jgi:hypothetical protein
MSVRVLLVPGVEPAAVVERFPSDGVDSSKLAVLKDDGRYVLTTELAGRPDALRAGVSTMATRTEVESIGEE